MPAAIATRHQLQLARHFIARDLRNRYLGSLTGAMWALLQPLLLLGIYAIVFVEILKVRWPDAAVGAAYVPYLATGLWPWTAFAEALARGTNAIPEHAALLSKVPLPRPILVLAPVAGSFLIHGVGFIVVLVVLALTGTPAHLTGLPWALATYVLLFAFALGLAWLTAALQVFVRDLAPIVAQVLTLWFFLTPIFFAREMVPAQLGAVLAFNPLAGFVDAFRAALLGVAPTPGALWGPPIFAALAFAAGWFVFGRLSRHFEDFLLTALVELEGVAKRFPRVARPADRIRALGRLLLRREPRDPIPVLENVSLRVERGQSLGIIGENGAGKSTLLKVLTGVLAPSAGTVRVNGSHAALLELGAGFHPEYTGRANVEMAGALMGFSSRELKAKLDEILEFADIGRYVDEPVKHYSSGMVVRLGFALVAARRPDLLITDEVLAVGDEAFQRKCVAWTESYLGGGGTLLLVSHSMYHVQKLCRQALWLHKGRVEAYGDVHDVTQRYLAYEESRIAADGASQAASSAGLEFAVTELALNGDASEAELALEVDADLEIRARLRSRNGRAPHFALGIVRADGTPVYGTGSEIDGAAPQRLDEQSYGYALSFPRLALLPGSYLIRAHALDPEGMRLFDCFERRLIVRGASREFGLVRLEHRWIEPERAGDATRAARAV